MEQLPISIRRVTPNSFVDDVIVHKNVSSSDGQEVGNVDATDADSVVIITDGAKKEYKISKSKVYGYNGAEVFSKLTIVELEKYRI